MIHRKDAHLPWRWLADRRDGALDAARAAEADAHLVGGCALCAARDRTVRRLVAAVAAGPLESPPADADRRARAVYALRRRAPRVRDALDVTVGVLVVDQRSDLALALRSPGDETRRLLWDVGGWDVDASVVLRGGRADLLAQVVPPGDEPSVRLGGEVRAVRGRRTVATSPVAPDGRFTFRGLPCGAWVFEGRVASPLGDRAFVLPLVVLE